MVIADITKRMGAGMMEFVDKPVNTIEDYNLYCHYVAGLVGIGLAKLFSASGLEDEKVSHPFTSLKGHHPIPPLRGLSMGELPGPRKCGLLGSVKG